MSKRLPGRLAASAALVLALAACGGTSGTEGPAQTGSNRPAETSESAPATDEPTAQESTADANEPLKFGATRTYTDGLSVTVSKPVKFTPGPSAAKEPAKAYVKFTVTMVNGTAKMFDPSIASATVQSGNTEASTVYDDSVGGSPSTKLLKGRETRYQLGFGVADPKDIVLELSPGFEYESTLFTN